MTTKIDALVPRTGTEGEGCLSELEADQLFLEELSAVKADELRAHLKGCDGCQLRMEFRAGGLAAMNVDAAKMLRGIEEKLSPAPSSASTERTRWWSSWFKIPQMMQLGAVAAAAVLVFVVAPTPEGVDTGVCARRAPAPCGSFGSAALQWRSARAATASGRAIDSASRSASRTRTTTLGS